jgi:hypothetical protein
MATPISNSSILNQCMSINELQKPQKYIPGPQ